MNQKQAFALCAVLLALGMAQGWAEWREITWTAYCSGKCCCGPKAARLTASGQRFRPGIVASDPSIPFGSRVYAWGQWFTVQDRGGAIKGNRMDLSKRTHREAREFGVQIERTWVQPSRKP